MNKSGLTTRHHIDILLTSFALISYLIFHIKVIRVFINKITTFAFVVATGVLMAVGSEPAIAKADLTKAQATQNNTVAALPQQCEQLFKATESLIAEAEKQPGTHTQLNKIKSKLNQSKQQILEMELATQIKSCDVGLARLASKQNDTTN